MNNVLYPHQKAIGYTKQILTNNLISKASLIPKKTKQNIKKVKFDQANSAN